MAVKPSAYSRATFLGASLKSFSSSVGWNMGSPSALNASLVVDPANGDVFEPNSTNIGTPVFFQFGAFRFNGLLQKFETKNEVSGLPTYDVVIVDPREILEGTQIILGAYSGSVGTVRNLINVFGFWENQGFGLSYANDAGIPWTRVRDGLLAICNQPSQTVYGGPLSYRGVAYGLDLSELPAPPNFYRVGGSYSVGLLELIAQICEDGGCDFFVELRGYVIKIRTVSRANQPPLGTISSLVNSNVGDVVRSSSGLEARNETTSSFLVGGDYSTLNLTDSLTSFWGYDIVGSPILGVEQRLDLRDNRYQTELLRPLALNSTFVDFKKDFLRPDGVERWPDLPLYVIVDNEIIKLTQFKENLFGDGLIGKRYKCERAMLGTFESPHVANRKVNMIWWSEYCDFMNLNASPISDIIGAVIYPCSTFEMRLAKVNVESWSAYMTAYRPELAEIIGVMAPFVPPAFINGEVKLPDLINENRKNVQRMNEEAIAGTKHANTMRVYEFVRGYADEFMGRKFACSLPFVLQKQDPETLRVTTSYEISDGGYLPEGSQPLGLSALNEDVFKQQDGRFRCFAVYDDLDAPDFSSISPNNSVVEDEVLYVEAQASPTIIYTPTPAAVVTFAGAFFEEAADAVGSMDIVAAVFQMKPEQAQGIFKDVSHGNLPVKIHPKHKIPYAVAVPLKSNTLTYGPWYVAGSAGKVRFEADSSLVPWNYGGYDTMNSAGAARVTSSVTNMNVSEAGGLELAGMPLGSLGDVLQAGGPNITNINVSMGTNGVTTSYAFQTYTPRFGVFSKASSERLKRMNLTAVELRKSLRTAAKENAGKVEAVGNAVRAKAFLANAPKAVKRESPHSQLFSFSYRDRASTTGVFHGISTATYDEILGSCGADNDERWKASSVMSLSGLLRPFCTKPSGGVAMSSYEVTASGFDGLVLTRQSLDPFKSQNDVMTYSWGDTYAGMNALRRQGDYSNARLMALRGPLVVSGFGHDTEGYPVPSGWLPDEHGNSTLLRSDLWKTGPVDLMWDNRRGVWTSHDVIKGRTAEAIAADLGSGTVQVYVDNSGTTWNASVFNWGTEEIASGQPVHCFYNVLDNKWYAEPTAGAGGSGVSWPAATSGTYMTLQVLDGENPYFTSEPDVHEVTFRSYGDQIARTLMRARPGANPHFFYLPSGVPFVDTDVYGSGQVLAASFSSRNGAPETYVDFTQDLLIHKVTLGGSGLAPSGQLDFGTQDNEWHLSFLAQKRLNNLLLALPSGDPHADQVMQVVSWDDTEKYGELDWRPGVPSNPGRYAVLGIEPGGDPAWTGCPTVDGLFVGGPNSQVPSGSYGYLRAGGANYSSHTTEYRFPTAEKNYFITLPNTVPATDVGTGEGSGYVLGMDYFDGASGTLSWRRKLFLEELTLGGQHVSAANGRISLGTPGNKKYFSFEPQTRTESLLAKLPAGDPSVGNHLTVSAFSGGEATLEWGWSARNARITGYINDGIHNWIEQSYDGVGYSDGSVSGVATEREYRHVPDDTPVILHRVGDYWHFSYCCGSGTIEDPPAGPEAMVIVEGSGTSESQAVIAITSYDLDASSHDFYRHTATMSGDPVGNGSLLATNFDPTTDYIDSTVSPSSTYYYQAISHSPYLGVGYTESNEISIVIPASGGGGGGSGEQIYSDYGGGGNHDFTVPPGITSVTIECWAAGGGGADAAVNTSGGGGGGGGYSASTFSVTPGDTITCHVALPGAPETNGEDSTATGTGVSLTAYGGTGATDVNGTSGGSGGTGTTNYSGGAGANGSLGSDVGGGGAGSGAGSASVGNSGSSNSGATGGAGGASVGGGSGSGGNGGNSAVPGDTGNYAGGGGGGGGYSGGASGGGYGAGGKVRITW